MIPMTFDNGLHTFTASIRPFQPQITRNGCRLGHRNRKRFTGLSGCWKRFSGLVRPKF